jgi:hypothetical protein
MFICMINLVLSVNTNVCLQFCQRNIPGIQIFWYAPGQMLRKMRQAQVHICPTFFFVFATTDHFTSSFTPASRRPSGDRGCPALLTDWVPFVKVTRKLKRRSKIMQGCCPSLICSGTPTETLYISESIDNQWKNEYWACKDPNSQHE